MCAEERFSISEATNSVFEAKPMKMRIFRPGAKCGCGDSQFGTKLLLGGAVLDRAMFSFLHVRFSKGMGNESTRQSLKKRIGEPHLDKRAYPACAKITRKSSKKAESINEERVTPSEENAPTNSQSRLTEGRFSGHPRNHLASRSGNPPRARRGADMHRASE